MTDENDIVASRRQKLVELRRRGAAYPNGFERSDFAAQLHARYGDFPKEALEEKVVDVKVAGRIMLRRVMGKASFITLQDGTHQDNRIWARLPTKNLMTFMTAAISLA